MTRFLLTGFASEFSLRPLAAELVRLGHQAHAIDLADGPLTANSAPPGDGPLVLITSQHSLVTAHAFREHHRLAAPHYATPGQLRADVGASLLVYVPHDLLDPVLGSEVERLSVFDLFAAPDGDHWWARAHVPVVEAGWVGSLAASDTAPADVPLDRGVLFITDDGVVDARGGGDYLLRTYEQTLATGIAVKFAVWPTTEALSAPLARAGVPLVSPSLPAATVIEHAPLVASNGASSVLCEAALIGHRPIGIAHPDDRASLAAALRPINAIVCSDDEFSRHASQRRSPGAGIRRFDTAALLASIEHRLAQLTAGSGPTR